MLAQFTALEEGSAARFCSVWHPSCIRAFTLGISAFSTLYEPHPSSPMRITCSATGLGSEVQDTMHMAMAMSGSKNSFFILFFCVIRVIVFVLLHA